jgi:hypothetical protein
MTNDLNPSALDALAARCAADPFFLASALAAYQQRHGLNEAALAALLGCPPAALLGCPPAVLTLLRLCRRPGAAAPGAAAPGPTAEDDVAKIAHHFGVDAAALWRMVEEVAG